MAPRQAMTEADYLALEAVSETKNEFVNGEIIAMSGASFRHNLIAANLTASIHARKGGCVVLGADQRVQIQSTGLYCYPDLTITCARPQIRPTPPPGVLLNPTVVIEILSESTEAWDRGGKARHYRRLESLRELVLVRQDVQGVEVFRRKPDGEWVFSESAEGGFLRLECLSADIPLSDIYAGTADVPED